MGTKANGKLNLRAFGDGRDEEKATGHPRYFALFFCVIPRQAHVIFALFCVFRVMFSMA
jgi:hypothetical protein